MFCPFPLFFFIPSLLILFIYFFFFLPYCTILYFVPSFISPALLHSFTSALFPLLSSILRLYIFQSLFFFPRILHNQAQFTLAFYIRLYFTCVYFTCAVSLISSVFIANTREQTWLEIPCFILFILQFLFSFLYFFHYNIFPAILGFFVYFNFTIFVTALLFFALAYIYSVVLFISFCSFIYILLFLFHPLHVFSVLRLPSVLYFFFHFYVDFRDFLFISFHVFHVYISILISHLSCVFSLSCFIYPRHKVIRSIFP